MAIRSVNISGGFSPTITRECDSSADFSGISNNTIFKNLGDSLIYQKDSNGNITSSFFTGGTISGGLTATTISGGTFFGNGSGLTNVTAVSTITVGSTPITSGTNSRIPFNNSGVYGESSGLTWSNSTGRLAIGGIAPNYDFSIMRNAPSTQVGMQISNNGSGTAASDGLFVGIGSDNNAYVQTYDANSVNLGANTQIALTLTSTNTRFGGTLSNVAANTGAVFQVNGNSSTSGLGFFQLRNNAGTPVLCANENGKVFINIGTVGTAQLHIGAGTATAGSAPIKIDSGSLMTTPETGAVEYNGTNLFFTPSSTRNILAQISGSTALSSSQIPFATTNGYLTSTSNLSWDNSNNRLNIGTSSPAYSIGSLWIQGNNTSGSFSRNSVVINTANQTSESEIMLTTDAVNSTVTCLRQYGTSSDFPFTIYGINPQGYAHLFADNAKGVLIGTNQGNTFIGMGTGLQNTASNLFFWGGASGVSIKNGTTTATAYLHIGAGSAAASSAPLKLTSGTNLTTPEAGAIEYNGTNLFFTPSSTRNILAQISGSTALTTGQIPFATTNGYLTSTSNLSWDSTNNYLTLTSNAATTGPTLRLYDTNASGRNFEISNANGANYATMYWKVGASAGAAPSTTLMTLTNTGYLALGLGNTNGSYPIDIGGAGVSGTLLRAKGSQANHDIVIGNSSNNAFIGAYNSSFQILTQGNTSFPAVTITYSTTPNVGIALGTSNPTARLHIAAGTATANTAPLKLTAGTNLTTPEDGAFEFDGTNLYFTVGGVRKTVSLS